MTHAASASGLPPVVVVPSADDVAGGLMAVSQALSDSTGTVDISRDGIRLPVAAIADLDRAGVTVTLTDPGGTGPALRTGHARVLAVGTDRHPLPEATTRAVGWLRVAAADREAVAQCLAAAADQARVLGVDGSDPFSWVLLAIVRAGVSVRAESLDPWPWAEAGDTPALTDAEVARIRLVRANRADDSGYSVAVLRRLSTPLTALAARRGWAPNAITVVSLIVGLGAAALFASGERWALVAGAVALQASLVIDCSDGEVARLTGRFSRTGAWLDAVTDRVKEFAAYAGLAVGGAAVWGLDLWWAAAATMVLQTVRHLTDYTFDLVQRGWEAASVRRPLAAELTTSATAQDHPSEAAVGAVGAPSMIRRALFLPIGERWLLISVTAALLGPAWVFGLLLGLGAVSFCYANLGRALRTRRWTGGPVAMGAIVAQLDTAPFGIPLPLGARSGTLLLGASVSGVLGCLLLATGAPVLAGATILISAVLLLGVRAALFRPAWAAPAAVAAIEMVPWLVAGMVLGADGGPWLFALLFTIAFHRYDLLYRATAGQRLPVWLSALCGGAPVRLAVVAVTVMVAPGALVGVAAVLAVYLAVVAVVVASVQWVGSDGGAAR